MKILFPVFILLLVVFSCKKDPGTDSRGAVTVDSVFINHTKVANNGKAGNVDFKKVVVDIHFSGKVDTLSFKRKKIFFSGAADTFYAYKFAGNARELQIIPSSINALSSYRFLMDVGENMGVKFAESFTFTFSTSIDSTPKFPLISSDSLLTLVQKRTFRYFWDYGHPVSGLARERYGSGDVVTSGGTGFGIMAIVVGIERGFITRQQGLERLQTMANFLNLPSTDKFHGAFPHWLNGSTGKAIAFSTKDNGGDLVETAYLMQGLLTARQYFLNGNTAERALCDTIQKLWRNVEWTWYQNNQNKLYWHWSPNYNWEMNMPVSGWNEALIVYVLAASSPTYFINKQVYDEGWARNGSIKNGKSFYGIPLPLGEDRGGPLFYAHYSFLGLDPRNLQDAYANYLSQNIAHARIHYEYSKADPRNYGYSDSFWGLTASDIPSGYTASSPNNDVGVIAPTAALSSFPYTPQESTKALNFFYYVLGDKLWGEYGFYDAVSLNNLWFANSYLAIDQGP
ncbi:MAG TPA: glucoamylase family protein, partial [Bacteroidales bacterium]|nr:glucoamylase family protein [Bacteroidales bacterium]